MRKMQKHVFQLLRTDVRIYSPCQLDAVMDRMNVHVVIFKLGKISALAEHSSRENLHLGKTRLQLSTPSHQHTHCVSTRALMYTRFYFSPSPPLHHP